MSVTIYAATYTDTQQGRCFEPADLLVDDRSSFNTGFALHVLCALYADVHTVDRDSGTFSAPIGPEFGSLERMNVITELLKLNDRSLVWIVRNLRWVTEPYFLEQPGRIRAILEVILGELQTPGSHIVAA